MSTQAASFWLFLEDIMPVCSLFARWIRYTRHMSGLLVIGLLLGGCTPRPAATAAHPPLPNAPPRPAPGVSSDFTPPVFADISDASGVRFQHHAYHTPSKYLIETMGSGCAFLDYDGDGWSDILLLNNAPLPGSADKQRATLRLFHNNHNNTFTDVTHQAGLDAQTMYAMGVAVGDYDNDGREDFYISCVLGPGHLFHNEGGGRFTDVTARAGVGNAGKWGASCVWVDYDNDGKLDLFVCNYVKYGSLKEDEPCFSGLNQRIYCIPSNYETSACALYHNEGNGRFTDATQRSGIGKATARGKALGVSVWDYDGDGFCDLFVANDTVPGFLLHNRRDGTFEEIGMPLGLAVDEEGNAHSGMGIDAADVNNDGRCLLAITNYQGQQTSLYQQSADNVFTDIRHNVGISEATGKTLGFGTLFFDYDNDGFKDIIQVNGHVQDDIERREPATPYAQPTLLFQNRRNGTFREVGLASGAPFTTRLVGRGVAVGDIDNDGRMDALITGNDGKAMLWRNNTIAHPPNHWLTLKLAGTRSNRDGIGAMVSVTAGGVTQRVMVRSGSSYLSQSDLRAHFGLGTQTAADVEIRWPSGTIDKIGHVACDRIGIAHEGASHLE